MKAEDLIKWGVIAFAAWWVYETFFSTPTYTVKTLPTGQPTGTTVYVTDGASATDCTAGGGTNKVACSYTGSNWQNSTDYQAALAAAATVAAAQKGGSTSSGSTSSGSTSSGSTSGSSTSGSSATMGLDAMYTALLAAATAGMKGGDTAVNSSGGVLSATGNVWNFYLSQVSPSAGMAASGLIYSQSPTAANSAALPYTSGAYWGLVGPWIGSKLGLSGYRLGLAGLGAVLMRGRQ